jgi:hypothetical protein
MEAPFDPMPVHRLAWGAEEPKGDPECPYCIDGWRTRHFFIDGWKTGTKRLPCTECAAGRAVREQSGWCEECGTDDSVPHKAGCSYE